MVSVHWICLSCDVKYHLNENNSKDILVCTTDSICVSHTSSSSLLDMIITAQTAKGTTQKTSVQKKVSYLSFDESCPFQSGMSREPEQIAVKFIIASYPVKSSTAARAVYYNASWSCRLEVFRENDARSKWLWCRSEIQLRCIKEEPSPKMPAAWSTILLYYYFLFCFCSIRLRTIVSCWVQKQFSVLNNMREVIRRLTQHCTQLDEEQKVKQHIVSRLQIRVAQRTHLKRSSFRERQGAEDKSDS